MGKGQRMKAWVATFADLAGIAAIYFGFSWLLGGHPTLGGYAVCIGGYTLLKTYKENGL